MRRNTNQLLTTFAMVFLVSVYTEARPKAPFTVCVIQSDIPDSDEKKRVKNILKHLGSRFEGATSGTPDECSAHLIMVRSSEDEKMGISYDDGTDYTC